MFSVDLVDSYVGNYMCCVYLCFFLFYVFDVFVVIIFFFLFEFAYGFIKSYSNEFRVFVFVYGFVFDVCLYSDSV